MKYHTTCICAIIFSLGFIACSAQTNTNLIATEFEKGIHQNDSVQLLDVRTPSEYNTGHLPNALLADWNDRKEFNRRLEFIDKDQPVYIYCLSGGRSAEAAKKMRETGYEKVYELTGGINAWKAAGKEVEGKSVEKQMTPGELDIAINKDKLVLVDFGASWCPPCKKMEPVLESLQANNPGIFTLVKVDGGRDEEIVRQYKITALPVFILFRNGKQVWRKDGVAGEKEIAALLK